MSVRVIDGMSSADYHAHPALGSTSLKTLATRTPAHYQWDLTHSKHTPAFDLGTALHSIVIEQDETGIVEVEAASWIGKAAREERDEAYAEGKTPLLTKDLDTARAMRDSIMDHPVAKLAFTGHRPEASVFWEEGSLELKCRPDAWHRSLLVDLKSTVTADPREFGRTASNFGYHQSAAHYQDGVEVITGERLPFLFVLAEKTAPYLVSVVELDQDAIDLGRRLNDRAKRIYRECKAANRWPGYPDAEPVSLPTWASIQQEELAS